MDPARRRRPPPREPLWGSTRLLVVLVVLVVVLGALVGVTVSHAKGHRQEQAAPPSTAIPSTAARPAPTTSLTPRTREIPGSSSTRTTRALHSPASTSTATSSPSSFTTTSRAQAKSILRPAGSRPAGVAELLSPFVGGAGGDSCTTSGSTDADFQGPTVVVGSRSDLSESSTIEKEIGTPLNICFYRFSEGRTISVRVVSPTGDAQRFTVCHHCTKDRPTHLLWYTVAGQPLGRYQVIATQGTAKAVGVVIVSRQLDRTVYVAGQDPESGGTKVDPIGTAFRISLAGYGPNEQVWLVIYRNPNPTSRGVDARYFTRVLLGMSARGETLFNLQTGAGDPKGCYVFDTSPPAFRGTVQPVDWGNVFCIA